jgi:hypothetical protein
MGVLKAALDVSVCCSFVIVGRRDESWERTRTYLGSEVV